MLPTTLNPQGSVRQKQQRFAELLKKKGEQQTLNNKVLINSKPNILEQLKELIAQNPAAEDIEVYKIAKEKWLKAE